MKRILILAAFLLISCAERDNHVNNNNGEINTELLEMIQQIEKSDIDFNSVKKILDSSEISYKRITFGFEFEIDQSIFIFGSIILSANIESPVSVRSDYESFDLKNFTYSVDGNILNVVAICDIDETVYRLEFKITASQIAILLRREIYPEVYAQEIIASPSNQPLYTLYPVKVEVLE